MIPKSNYRIWWLNPGIAYGLCLLPFAISTYLISESEYVVYWRTSRYFDGLDLIYAFASFFVFLCGGFFAWSFPVGPRNVRWGQFQPRELSFLLGIFKLGVVLVVFAYIVWILSSVHNGVSLSMVSSMFHAERKASYDIRNASPTIPGVTTGTQFAMATFMVGTVLFFNGQRRTVVRWLIAPLILTVLRSSLHSERLALVEVLMPSTIISLYYCRDKFKSFLRGLPSFLWPLVATSLFYLFYTLSEYSRSWANFYATKGAYDSLWQFSLNRLIGYYVTALNNGALIYHTVGQSELPNFTFEWFFKFPIIGPWIFSLLSSDNDAYDYVGAILNQDANPEFNNISGIYSYAIDWGQIPSLLFFFIMGIIVYTFYRGFIRGTFSGIFIYPFLFIGITEIARVPYWFSTRAFPSWVLLFITLYGLNKIKQQQRNSYLKSLTHRHRMPANQQPLPIKQ